MSNQSDPSNNSIQTLRDNIAWHIELTVIQVKHAQKVKGRARSGYYKIAIILTATIVEAVLHALLARKIGSNGIIDTGKYEIYEPHCLPKKIYNSTEELVIAKRRPEKIKIANNPDFSVLNSTCLKEKIISKRLFKKTDSVRKIRNRIHIQGLNYVDRSYTKSKVEYVSGVVNELIALYNKSVES